jgi:hypothetical protein
MLDPLSGDHITIFMKDNVVLRQGKPQVGSCGFLSGMLSTAARVPASALIFDSGYRTL